MKFWNKILQAALILIGLYLCVTIAALAFMQVGLGPAGTFTYQGSVTSIAFSTDTPNTLDIKLGNETVDGCFLETQNCKPANFAAFSVPEPGTNYPDLGSPVSISLGYSF